MSDCAFCEIVRGEAPASVVYQDDAVIALMDIQPINPGHVLVIPRKHAVLVHELDNLTAARSWQVAIRVGEALRRSGIPCEGINFLIADGEAAFQDVMHFHIHVIPRVHGDGFGLTFPPDYETAPGRPQLDAYASAIRSAAAAV